jgi:hypothetical protein
MSVTTRAQKHATVTMEIAYERERTNHMQLKQLNKIIVIIIIIIIIMYNY